MTDARSAYLLGRSGGKRPSSFSSPSSLGQSRAQERANKAFDAGAKERDRERRIRNTMKREKDRDPTIGTLSNEELEKIQDQADRSGKNPYNVSTEGGITTLGEETTKRQKPTIGESLDNLVSNFTIMGKSAPLINEFLDKLVGKKIDKSTLKDPDKLAILEARIRRGDFGRQGTKLEDELFKEGGEYFDLVNEIFADDLKSKENIEKYGQDVTAEDILRGNLKTAGIAADPDITFRFDEEAAKKKFATMPATRADLVDLANLANTFPGGIQDPELKAKILEARAELNRQGVNPQTGGGPNEPDPTSQGGPGFEQDTGGGGGGESTEGTDPDKQFYGYNLGPAEIMYPGSDNVFVDPSQGPLQSLFVNNYQGNPNNVGIASAAEGMFVDNEPSLPLKLQDIKYEKRTNMMRNMDRIQPETNVMQGNMDLAPNLNRGI